MTPGSGASPAGSVRQPASWITFRRVAGYLALAAGALGLVGFSGWWLGIPRLTTVLPHLASMKVNTALAFILTGAALWARTRTPLPQWAIPAARVCSAVVVLLAAGTLLEHLTSRSFGIDTALFGAAARAEGFALPGRMSPGTALSFLLLGIATFILERDVANWLAIVPSALGLVSVLGYVDSVLVSGQVVSYSSMALHTGIGFVLLSTAVVLARPDRGIAPTLLGDGPDGQLARRMLPATYLIPLITVLAIAWGTRTRVFSTEVAEGLTVVVMITALTIVVMVTAARVRDSHSHRTSAEQQLRQSQKMEAVGRLAGGVAHDFNNLLTVIIGSAALLAEDTAPDRSGTELLGDISKAADRAALLTRQLLAFSRKQVLEPRDIDLNEVVRGIQRLLRRVIGEDVQLSDRLGATVSLVHVDPGQLEQALLNLAVNARDAMPTGGAITLETANVTIDAEYASDHVDAEPGEYVCITLTDTGTGMSTDVRSHIFEPFFTTKGPDAGTGLGLAMVHGFVHQSGGHIEVYSEQDVGTSFKIYLPSVTQASGSGPAEPVHVPARSGGTETILLAEDDLGVRQLARRILTSRGYTVLTASNGDEAMDVAAAHAGVIDLLVTDVIMPGTGGRALSERFAASRPGVPVLFVSGYTDDAVVRHGLLEEKVNFLHKPFSADALARRVREVLDQAPRA